MPIEGPLRELGIHDVFQLLDLSRKTGVLRVTSELRHNVGTVYFENGAVVFAEIRSNPHPLGALLLRTGRIAEADLERARDMQTRQGDRRRIGEILVSLGAVTPRELQRQVRFQIEEVVFELMSWNEGYFSLNEGATVDLPSTNTVRIPVEALLMEGARRIDEWSRIENRVRHLGVIPTLAPPPETPDGELDLLPPEWEVLALVDGERDVRGIAAALGRSDFDVAKTLFGLESAGIIVIVDPGSVKRVRTTTTADLAELVARAEDALRTNATDAARAAAEAAAQLSPHDPAVHLLLGRAHLACGRAPEAVEELRRAVRLDPLLAPAYRFLGYALVQTGRFIEALEQWEQWQRLAPRVEGEPEKADEVRRARDAAAQGVAGRGLKRPPHPADAHDLYARILADRHDYERAFDEWDMALRIAPAHTGALKGLAFLYFKVGDLAQAEAHLLTAKEATPDDPSIDQALALVRGRETEVAASAAPAPAPPAPLAEAPA